MRDIRVPVLVVTSLLFGVVGFLDDFIKVVLKRNLGLSAKQKFLLQLVVAAASVAYLYFSGLVDSTVYIPFMRTPVNLSYFYIPFCIFVMLATVNSVNLTDGLDGLASTVTLVVSLFFTAAALYFKDNASAVFSLTLVGALIGFLIHNAYPARVFMGDTGSLFLGGAVSIIAILLKLPFFIIIIGLVYLLETLSVMIQVTSFKLTGKRVFKMSPIHHHFEMCGFSETKIVLLFSGATVLLLIVCMLALYRIVL